MRFILPILLFAVSADLFAQTSYVAPTRILKKKGYQLGVEGDYWNSTKRIDKDGNKFDFTDGESFKRVQGGVFGDYGLTENLQIGGGVRFRQNQSTVLNTTTNETDTTTSSGIESTYFNLMYAFKPVDRFQYALEGQFRFRPFTNEEVDATTNKMILGDDGHSYSAGLGMTWSSKTNNFLTGRIGYRQPGTDLSSEIYWQFEGALAWRYVALVAGVNGISSMGNDPYSNKPAEKPVFNTGNTQLYNSTNREMIAPYAGFNVALGDSWRVEFRGSQVISGKSTDLGTSLGASLIRRVEPKNTDQPDRRFKDYDFEASVTKVSPAKGFVVIDKGLAEDVQKGMKIDFYEFDYVGGNILLASGTVIQIKADTAIVKITHTYNTKKELKEGIVARGSFR